MLYITLRQYEYILAVAEHGSLTAAAAALNVSQPSLSVAISRVEQQVEAIVFHRRKGTTVQLTPFGHGFVEKARALLDQARALERPDAPAPFTLGCFQDIAPWYLAPALSALDRHIADRQFEGREGRFADLAEGLTCGRIDLALSYDIGFPAAFHRRPVARVRPTAFLPVSHPLAGAQTLALEAFTEDPLILFDEDLSEGFMRRVMQHLGLTPQVAHYVHSLEMMRSFAAHGTGVGISYSCPPGSVSYDGAQLVQIPISTPEAEAEIFLIWSHLKAEDPTFEQIIACLDDL